MFKIGEVFRSMWRNAAMTIASLILIFLTMLVLGAAVILSVNTSSASARVVSKIQVHVYVNSNLSKSTEEQIKKEIEAKKAAKEVSFSSKDEQLEEILKNFSEADAQKIKSYFNGSNNPLNDVYYVQTKDNVDLKKFADEVATIDGVQSTDYGSNQGANKLISSMNLVKFISIGIVIFLLVVTIFLIVNTIKLTINSRRKEIEIMRLVGATKRYITFPFTFEGFILGTIGSALSFIVLMIVYTQIYSQFAIFMGGILYRPEEVQFLLFFCQIILGILLGIISSLIAIRRYLRV